MAASVPQEEAYARGLARAVAGAVIFGFPLLMTMEMWQLGFHMDRVRLALFLIVLIGTVTGLSMFAGFHHTRHFLEDVLDALAALLVGFAVSAAMLTLFGLLRTDTALREAVGMIAIQSAPASIGAILATRQLGGTSDDSHKVETASYPSQLFLMAAGALFVGLNVAPTEEMILIGFKMTGWHAVALVAVSIGLLHALVFTVGFAGQKAAERPWPCFLHFTLAGYGIALMVSLYVLWTFGRLDSGLSDTIRSVVVLGFPAALGAAIARLVV